MPRVSSAFVMTHGVGGAHLSPRKDLFQLQQASATRITRTKRIRPARLSRTWFSAETLQPAGSERERTEVTEQGQARCTSSCLQSSGSDGSKPTACIRLLSPCHCEHCPDFLKEFSGQERQKWDRVLSVFSTGALPVPVPLIKLLTQPAGSGLPDILWALKLLSPWFPWHMIFLLPVLPLL